MAWRAAPCLRLFSVTDTLTYTHPTELSAPAAASDTHNVAGGSLLILATLERDSHTVTQTHTRTLSLSLSYIQNTPVYF